MHVLLCIVDVALTNLIELVQRRNVAITATNYWKTIATHHRAGRPHQEFHGASNLASALIVHNAHHARRDHSGESCRRAWLSLVIANAGRSEKEGAPRLRYSLGTLQKKCRARRD